MTPATSNRRLLKLADFLEKLPRKRFDFGSWVGPDWKGAPDLSCGTTACALGWATTMPEFKRLGLYLLPGYGIRTDQSPHPLHAAQEIFGLTSDDAEELFVYQKGGTRTPKQWARYVRKWIKERSA